MASVNIGESDFEALALAAIAAKRAGDTDLAERLDKLARKANAALSNAYVLAIHVQGMPKPPGLTWRDVPSILDA